MAQKRAEERSSYQRTLEGLKRITPDDLVQEIWRTRALILLARLKTDVANYALTTGNLIDLLFNLFTRKDFPEANKIRILVRKPFDLKGYSPLAQQKVGNEVSGYWNANVYCAGHNLVISIDQIFS